MLSSEKLPGYRFSLAVIGYAVWLYHRFTLSYRDVEELLFEPGILVTHESLRSWCINFSAEFAASGNTSGVQGGISTRST